MVAFEVDDLVAHPSLRILPSIMTTAETNILIFLFINIIKM